MSYCNWKKASDVTQRYHDEGSVPTCPFHMPCGFAILAP